MGKYDMEFYVLLLILVILVGLFAGGVRWLNNNKRVDIRSVTKADKWFVNALIRYARSMTEYEYNNNGKPIYTKKGELRVNFKNDMNRCYSELSAQFYTGNYLNDDVCNYVIKEYFHL